MSEAETTRLGTLGLAGGRRADSLCGRFEAAWKAAGSAGPRPRIEDHLEETPAAERPALLCELILVDVLYRNLGGEDPRPEDYRDRFPGLDPSWLERAVRLEPPRPSLHPEGAALGEVARPISAVERFQVLRPHAQGGLGVVSVALDTELHREVALKEIRPEQADDPQCRARFLVEGELTGRLEHPGVVPVHSLGTDGRGRPFYVMRFVRGESLKVAVERFHQDGGLPGRGAGPRALAFRKLLGRFLDVCHAVAYAHSRGVLHRDLKPANILLGPFGETLVVDWGLAKVVGRPEPVPDAAEATLRPASGSGSVETLPGTAVGTPAFMSPEQAEGHIDELGPASDIYSLGATLYCLLAGAPPLAGRDVIEVLRHARRGEFHPPRRVNRRVPPALEAVCLKAMAFRPEGRYASADALAEDLEHWLADEPVAAWREPWTARAARWGRRHKPVVAGTAVLLAVAVAALALGTALLEREQRRTEEQRDRAVAKSQEASERAESLERQLYLHRVNLAYRECLANNVALADRLLDGCPEARRGWEWAYCRRLCHLETLTIGGEAAHHGRSDVALSPDGTTIAAGHEDGTISLWDAATGRPVQTIRGPRTPVLGLAFSPDGARLAAGGLGVVKLWEVRSGRELRSLAGPAGYAARVRFSPDGLRLAAGSSTGVEAGYLPGVKVWEAATGRELASFRERRWGQLNLAFSPDGRRLATVLDWETTVSFWDVATGHRIRVVDTQAGEGIFSVAFAPDGRRLALGCRDGTLLLWDAEAKSAPPRLRGHTSIVSAVAFSPDGRLLASAGWDGALKLWDVAADQEVATYRGHTDGVRRAHFSPDGARLISLGGDMSIKTWDVTDRPEVLTLGGNFGWAFRVAFSPDSRRLVTAGYNFVRVRDAATGQTLAVVRVGTGGVQGLALSPDGRQAAASGEFAQWADLWDLDTGRRLATFRGHTGRLRALAFAPNGRQVATAAEDRTVRLWDAATGREVLVLRGHTGGVFGVTFAPDGRRIASMGRDETVRLWDAATGQELCSFPVVGQRLPNVFGNVLAFSPDGRRLAAAGPREILVWDAQSGREELRLAGHTGWVNAVAFSRDGGRLVSAGGDNTIKLWDAATGEEVFTLRGHSHGVLGVAVSPDGARIASASMDTTVKVWEAAPPEPGVARRRHAVARAESLVEPLFVKALLKEDVLERLRADPNLAEPIRAVALEMAAQVTLPLSLRNSANRQIVRDRDRARERYERALRHAEEVCHLQPEDGPYRNTLGVAQYRLGRYQDAVETLTQAARLNAAAFKGSIPADLAFLAMAHHRLGHRAEAQDLLARLRQAMTTSRWRRDSESNAILREAEALIDPRK